jgi:protein-disulfide isomerase
MAQAGSDVRLVLRYTPLHQGSDQVVRILEAARNQDRFQSVLEAMLARQPEWAVHGAPDNEKAWSIAASTGLDLAKARKHAVTPAVDNVLAVDVADLQANGVKQTPTFFVNGQPLTEFSPQGLANLVKRELDKVEAGS